MRGTASEIATTDRSAAERELRWNATFIGIDFAFFGMAMALAHQTTVLPTFVSQLTDSTLLIGLIATAQTGGWLLPQLIAASHVVRLQRKKPFMIAGALPGRLAYLVLALATLLLGTTQPGLLLALFYLSIAALFVSDGVVSVAWYDIVSRALPVERRGRLLGMMQTATGLASALLGGVVASILVSDRLPFPANYAILFALAGGCLMIALGALLQVREPPPVPTLDRPTAAEFWRAVVPIVLGQPDFRRVTLARLFVGMGTMIYPFYVVYATRHLGVPTEAIGGYLSAQVAGGVLAGLLLGYLGDRSGIRRVIQAAAVLTMLGPGVGLLTLVGRDALGWWTPVVVAVCFLSVGISFSVNLLGYMNYVLAIAPLDQRATYAGLFNTLNGLLLVVPPLAGLLLGIAGYGALFGASLGCMVIALAIASQLTEPQREGGPGRA
ncbi:MAG: MFS transporter [Chloroflexi bacterium]|nr:MFS transporter [Chloroflexota bacterium]